MNGKTDVNEIVYHGGGYVGLSGSVYFALGGVRVKLFDPMKRVTDLINEGKSHVPSLGEFIGFDFKTLVDAGMLVAINDFEAVKDKSIHLIAVPTEKDAEPYMDIVLSVSEKLIKHHAAKRDEHPELACQPLVLIIESTLQPGTASTIVRMFHDNGFTVGSSAHFIAAPRRDWFVNSKMNVKHCTRVIGGWTPTCSFIGKEILGRCSDDIRVASAFEVAEMVKSLENSLLHIPVTYAMQVAHAYPDVDVDEVLALAGTHWRLPTYTIGAGVAGYCVPLGTKYIMGGAKKDRQPEIGKDALFFDQKFWRSHLAELLMQRTPKGGTIGILGVSYKRDFKVNALSPAIGVIEAIRNRNRTLPKNEQFKVWAYDPFYTDQELMQFLGDDVLSTGSFYPPDLSPNAEPYHYAINQTDAMLIVCNHSDFDDVTKFMIQMKKGMFILDGAHGWRDFQKLLEQTGFDYRRIGQRGWTSTK